MGQSHLLRCPEGDVLIVDYKTTSCFPLPLQTYRLPPGNILSETSRGLATNHRHGDIRVLLECVSKSSFASASLSDDILMAAIRVLASHSKEVCMYPQCKSSIRTHESC